MDLQLFQINNLITGCILEPVNELANNDAKKLYNNFEQLLSIYPVFNDKQVIYNNIITKILESGYKITIDNIQNIIQKHINIDILIEHITFTNNIINLCCMYNNWFLLEHIFDNKIVPTNNMFTLLFIYKNSILDQQKCIKLFLQYGYVITYNDFILITKNYIVLNNNINFDSDDIPKEFITDEFNKLCEQNDFYPNYYIPTINFLRKRSFYLNNISQIIEYKKCLRSNLQPDIQCLINACHSSGKKALQFFVEECKINPNNDCLFTVLSNDKPARKYIIEKYIECHPNQ